MKRYFIKPSGAAKFSCNVTDSASQESIDAVVSLGGYVEVSADDYRKFKING